MENKDLELKDLKTGKIILHIIIGKLKISDIKDVKKVYEILFGLNRLTFKNLKDVSYKNLMKAIEFRNKYTRLRKIDKAYVLEFIIEKLREIKDKEEIKEMIKLLLNRYDIPVALTIILEKLRDK